MVHTLGIMGALKKPEIHEKNLHGFKHFKLHDDGWSPLREFPINGLWPS